MRKKKDRTSPEPSVEGLAQLAKSLRLPDDALHDELSDACDTDAEMALEQICSESLSHQIRFLYERGYDLGRIAEIMQELRDEKPA